MGQTQSLFTITTPSNDSYKFQLTKDNSGSFTLTLSVQDSDGKTQGSKTITFTAQESKALEGCFPILGSGVDIKTTLDKDISLDGANIMTKSLVSAIETADNSIKQNQTPDLTNIVQVFKSNLLTCKPLTQTDINNQLIKQVNELTKQVNDLTTRLDQINPAPHTLMTNDLKFANDWGITTTSSEFHLYGRNVAGQTPQYPCTFAFFKNQDGQAKDFYLVGTNLPSVLNGGNFLPITQEEAAKCFNPYKFN